MPLIYIEPTDDDINLYKSLIKRQGVDVCRDQIDIYVINKAIDILTFGFLEISKKANIGRRRLSQEDDYKVRGFILCSYDHYQPDTLTIELVCAARFTKLGTPLMNAVEDKAREMGIKVLVLDCIDNDGLREWYENLGFVFRRTKYLRQDIPKVHVMMKLL